LLIQFGGYLISRNTALKNERWYYTYSILQVRGKSWLLIGPRSLPLSRRSRCKRSYLSTYSIWDPHMFRFMIICLVLYDAFSTCKAIISFRRWNFLPFYNGSKMHAQPLTILFTTLEWFVELVNTYHRGGLC
jgi:hypothetical protein